VSSVPLRSNLYLTRRTFETEVHWQRTATGIDYSMHVIRVRAWDSYGYEGSLHVSIPVFIQIDVKMLFDHVFVGVATPAPAFDSAPTYIKRFTDELRRRWYSSGFRGVDISEQADVPYLYIANVLLTNEVRPPNLGPYDTYYAGDAPL
jgi:hypothetical protein